MHACPWLPGWFLTSNALGPPWWTRKYSPLKVSVCVLPTTLKGATSSVLPSMKEPIYFTSTNYQDSQCCFFLNLIYKKLIIHYLTFYSTADKNKHLFLWLLTIFLLHDIFHNKVSFLISNTCLWIDINSTAHYFFMIILSLSIYKHLHTKYFEAKEVGKQEVRTISF